MSEIYSSLKCPQEHLAFLLRTFTENMGGWPETNPTYSATGKSAQEEESLTRARKMGAPI